MTFTDRDREHLAARAGDAIVRIIPLAIAIPPKPDLHEGIVTVALMTAMERSLETKGPVTVQSVLREHAMEY